MPPEPRGDRRPGRRWYVLAVLLCTLAPLCVLAASDVYAMDRLGKGMAEIVANMFLSDPRPGRRSTFPGTATWHLEKAGPWHARLFYEMARSEPPGLGALRCKLVRGGPGARPIELVPCTDDMPGIHSSQNLVSVEVFLFEIPEAGDYRFEAAYPDGADGPKLELGYGAGHQGEPVGKFWKRRRVRVLVFACVGLSIAGGLALGVVTWRRRLRESDARQSV